MIPRCRIYCYETKEMIVANDYDELSELFMALNADDSLYSEPMQSTGLLDINDKEIFEGDLVRVSMMIGKRTITSIGVVEFDIFDVCFRIRNVLGDHSVMPLYVTMFHARYFEVIGNIYQNKELVEG